MNKILIPFLRSSKYQNFLQALLEYFRELFRIENKQQVMEQEVKQRGEKLPAVTASETKKLDEKAKKLANAYSWIVFSKKAITDKAMS